MDSVSRHQPRYEPGKKPFGEYAVQRFVRWSGFYEQYEGQTDSGILVGIKVIFPDKGPSAERLPAACRPFSVGLIAVFDFKRLPGGEVAVITEPTTPSLRDRLSEGPLTQTEATGTLEDVTRALFSLEKRTGILPVLDPGMIVLRDDGALIDDHFLPALYDGGKYPIQLEQASYLAPEVDQDPPDVAATMFSLGILYYEMLTGHPPFSGGPLSVIARIRSQDAELDSAPAGARPLLKRLLAREARERFGGFDELLYSLNAALGRVVGDRSLLPPEAEALLSSPDTVRETEGKATGPRLIPLGENEQGYPEFRRTTDHGIMVLLPGGTFTMGTTEGRPEEMPPTEVNVGRFLIDKSPVTWEMAHTFHQGHDRSCDFCSQKNRLLPTRFMPTPQSARTIHDHTDFETRFAAINEAISGEGGEKIPVTYLTAPEMDAYAAAQGCELPSEAEWEFAYRGGKGSRYHWGDEPDKKMAWYNDSSGGRPHPIGQLPPNPYGLLDMAGSVGEICRDHFVKEIYEMIAAGAAAADELVTGVARPSPRRSVRGGSFVSSSAGITATFRSGTAPEMRSETRGMRLVMRESHAPDWAREAFTGKIAETPVATGTDADAEPTVAVEDRLITPPENGTGERADG